MIYGWAAKWLHLAHPHDVLSLPSISIPSGTKLYWIDLRLT